MSARVLVVDPHAPDPAVIAEAAALLRRGGLVAFPTETVYGLGANALDAAAVARIFAAKGRPSFNPLIAHVPDAAAARALVTAWPEAAERLAAAFWPGPLTLVLPKRAVVPDAVTAGLPAVAVRVPAHPVARALVAAAAVPVAAPSANRYTELSPTAARHVVRALGDRVDLVVDGGATTVGIESTVVDLTGVVEGGAARLLRPGTVSAAAIAAALGTSAETLGTLAPAAGDAPRLAPGMVERHYAPRAALWLYARDESAAVAARAAASGAARVGALALRDDAAVARAADRRQMPGDADGYARELYAALHAMDDAGCDVVLVQLPPDMPEWAGVRDRLRRAAHHDPA